MTQGRSKFDHQLASALDESAEELYEMAPCGYLTTTIDGRIVKVNQTFSEWLGFDRDELLHGKRLVDLLTVGGKLFYETQFALLLRMQEAVDEIALDLICKDGRILPVLINARQKRREDGEPLLNRFTIFNASERRMYERQLLSARDLYQTTLASIGDGVVTIDAAGSITYLNPVAEDLTGWKTHAAVGKPVEEILILRHESTGETVENPVIQALRKGVTVGLSNDTVLISKDGREIPIDDSGSPIRDSNGNVFGGVLVFRDITVQRLAAASLRKAHQISEANAAELRRSNEDLSQFAHVASHDLRSPLNTVVQFSQLLEKRYGKLLGNGGRELLTFIIDAAQRMRRLIDDLLAYAKVSGELENSVLPVDANAVLEVALANVQNLIQESGADISHDALPSVRIGETYLVQLFQNLIANAIRYRGDATPRIHLSAVEQGSYWLFSCRDNGIGIDAEFHQQIFEAFKRLHGIERPGSGIGLAVCKRIVTRLDGRIWVESQAGQGSTFFFTLPK